jgi:hypothetical protein
VQDVAGGLRFQCFVELAPSCNVMQHASMDFESAASASSAIPAWE